MAAKIASSMDPGSHREATPPTSDPTTAVAPTVTLSPRCTAPYLP